MMLSADPVRLALAAGLSLAYAGVCLAPWLRLRRKRRALERARGEAAPEWVVAYASQTGNAEQLAQQTAHTLRLTGVGVRACALSELDAPALQRAERVLFIVSTYGEGDAPDNGAAFCARVMGAALPLAQLPQLHYAVLALGDRGYGQYCGFGRALDAWLSAQGAAALFERIEVDRGATEAIDLWRQQLSHLAGTCDAPDWNAPAFGAWRLAARRLLNPGSAGAPLYHIELEPLDGALPQWESGDLVQVAAPAGDFSGGSANDALRPREYSIASIPADGRVHLLVRLHRHADGSAGLASGWLSGGVEIGAAVSLRLRAHRRFRLEDNAAHPLILIGNGSGMAGLRGHLKARAAAGAKRNWLIFGERHASHDYHYREDIERWRAQGLLPGLDMVFSRDQPDRLYVQDRLLERAAEVRHWVAEGAALYVCGSLNGMAGAVDLALGQVLGTALLESLAAEGRYRRDVY
jgi:sulfite reductase (NADPH) flavoprotein alpha-component